MSEYQLPSLEQHLEKIQNAKGLNNKDLNAKDVFDFNPEALRAEAAREFIKTYVESVRKNLAVEKVGIHASLGRFLAEDIISPINVPAADNSAMDGFCFDSRVLTTKEEWISLKIRGRVLAGDPKSGSDINDFSPTTDALKIMTGAVMPTYCDTVIPQELVETDGQTIRFRKEIIRAGDNRRLKGEDLQIGKAAVPAGQWITPSDLGLIASLGIGEVSVFRKLKVAFFSTGDEICSIGEELKPGSVYDSNRYTIFGMLSRLGLEVIDMGIVRDDPELLKAAFSKAASQADVVITSGGVSVGEADFTKQIMRELGDVAFWKLAIKPGRPMAFGKVKHSGKEAVLFGLPGNPVAVMVTFYQFVQEALEYMSGANQSRQSTTSVRLGVDLKKRPGRTEFLRGILTTEADGSCWVSPFGSQGSGILSSMSGANCFIILEHDVANLSKGSLVNIALFHGLL